MDAISTGGLFLTQGAAAGSPTTTAPSVDDDVIDLTVAATRAVPAVDRAIRSLSEADLAPLLAHHGYVPHGLAVLREQIAARLTSQGLPTRADQVIITNGAHQALSLIARQLVGAGDTVLVESPTFPGALDVFRRFGAQSIPVPVDEHGARADLLDDLIDRTRARLVFVSSQVHSPTGVIMDEDRRRHIAALADRTGIAVVDDLTLADTVLDAVELPPPIAAFASTPSVHTVGSVSKILWAGLRVGWVRTPEPWTARMLSTKTVADLGSPLLEQLVVSRLMPHLDEVLAERRTELAARRDLMCDLLTQWLPAWSFVRPAGGLCVWALLPDGNSVEFAEHARQRGVAVTPGPALSVDDGNRRAMRIVFARPEAVITEGVHRLADAWAKYADTDARPSERLLV